MRFNALQLFYIILLFVSIIYLQGCRYTFLPQNKNQQYTRNTDCHLKMYSEENPVPPNKRYRILGKCVGKSSFRGLGSSQAAFTHLEKCACKYGGDAIIFKQQKVKDYVDDYGRVMYTQADIEAEVIQFY